MVEINLKKIASFQLLWVAIGFTLGLVIIWWPMLNGTTLFNALFAYILASIGYAMGARDYVGWVPFLAIILVGIAGFTGRDLHQKPAEKAFKCFTAFVIGWALSRAIIYFLLDIAFFRGSIAMLPFMFGSILLTGIVGNMAINRPNFRMKKILNLWHIFSYGSTLFVALFLILPNLIAVAGLLPTPPETPSTGYGSVDSPYQVEEFFLSPEYPENMTGWWDDWAQEQEWKVYVFVPVGLESESAGVAVYLHGYQGEKIEYYRDIMVSLAGQGLVAIFPQYVSDMDLSTIPSDYELNYSLGGSDHPQHLPRYTMALFGVDAGLDFIPTDSRVNQVLGETKLDTNHMWIGGHSMGAGTTFYVMSELLGRGFGSESFVVDLEAPWIHATQPNLMGNMSRLPDHAQIHVVEYETELVVDKCIGRWQHGRLLARDGGLSLPAEQVLFLQVPSDYHGFPRLIASHYLPSGFIRDALADQSYYPRIEAQADYIADSASGDSQSAESAKNWFMTEGEMTDLGDWSDGVAVNPITIVSSPLELPDDNPEACPIS